MNRFITTILLSFCLLTPIVAQSDKVIEELRNKRRETMKAIEETNELISTNKRSTSSQLKMLNKLTAEVRSQRKIISMINNEINAIDNNQKRIESEIILLQKELAVKKEQYTKAIKSMSAQKSAYNEFIFIFSAKSISQSYARMRYLREYSAWRKAQAADITAKNEELKAKSAELDNNKKVKEETLLTKEQQKRRLDNKEHEQKQQVISLKNEQKSLVAELKKRQRQANELNRQIEKMISEEAVKSSKDSNRSTTSKGGYAMTPAERELSGSFEKNRGRLPLPLSGSYLIVSHFGEQQHQELKYVKTNNSGIDIQTKPGTEARTIFEGEVTKVFVVPGYNSSVIVRHGNYLSVYSNLSKVYVKAGDKVKGRQPLGTIYTDTEDDNSTIIHFQIWKEKTKLNPESWLIE